MSSVEVNSILQIGLCAVKKVQIFKRDYFGKYKRLLRDNRDCEEQQVLNIQRFSDISKVRRIYVKDPKGPTKPKDNPKCKVGLERQTFPILFKDDLE